MKTITNEELFNRVRTHLLTQAKKSIDPATDNCLYRGPDGTKCAVGILISDKYYSEYLENIGIGIGRAGGKVVEAVSNSLGVKLTIDNIELLDALQDVHDRYEVAQWPEKLEKVRRDFLYEEAVLSE